MDRYDYLYHHGILGQKWGVRRFQNKDGTLTTAGKKRYDIDEAKQQVKNAKKEYREEVRRYNKKTHNGLIYDKEASDALAKSKGKVGWAKEKLENEKIKDRALNEERVSAHRQKLIDGYINKGMTEKEAQIAAHKRARTEKILAATAAVAVTVATAYVVKNQIAKRVDKLIPPSTLLQNISTNDNKGVQDAFYASMTKMDNAKYRGMYATQLKNQTGGSKVFETKIGIKGGLKLASEKSATDVLTDLVNKDKNYAKDLSDYLRDSEGRYPLRKQNALMRKAAINLKKGKVDSTVYKALNISLTDHTLPTSAKVHKGLYDALKAKGYDAISDINDKKFSGYHASNPLIVFNGAAKTFVNSRREVGEKEIAKNFAKGLGDMYVKQLAPSIAVGAASLGVVKYGSSALGRRRRDQIVDQYKKEHPDTKLSYNEILDNYYK